MAGSATTPRPASTKRSCSFPRFSQNARRARGEAPPSTEARSTICTKQNGSIEPGCPAASAPRAIRSTRCTLPPQRGWLNQLYCHHASTWSIRAATARPNQRSSSPPPPQPPPATESIAAGACGSSGCASHARTSASRARPRCSEKPFQPSRVTVLPQPDPRAAHAASISAPPRTTPASHGSAPSVVSSASASAALRAPKNHSSASSAGSAPPGREAKSVAHAAPRRSASAFAAARASSPRAKRWRALAARKRPRGVARGPSAAASSAASRRPAPSGTGPSFFSCQRPDPIQSSAGSAQPFVSANAATRAQNDVGAVRNAQPVKFVA